MNTPLLNKQRYNTIPYHNHSPGRFGRQVSVTDIYHTIPYHTSGLRRLPCFSSVQPCFAEGIYWATGLSLTTPFTEGYGMVPGS